MSLGRYFDNDATKIIGGAVAGYTLSAVAGDTLQSYATTVRKSVQSIFGGSNTSTAKVAAQSKSLFSMFSGASKDDLSKLNASAASRGTTAAAGTTGSGGGLWDSIVNFLRGLLA